MTTTSAQVRFGADGLAKVESHLHLTGNTYIDCFTYDDGAPILTIKDAHVEVSLSVPGRDRVTEDDVACARRLAEAVGRYAAEVAQLAAASRDAEPGAETAGQAA